MKFRAFLCVLLTGMLVVGSIPETVQANEVKNKTAAGTVKPRDMGTWKAATSVDPRFAAGYPTVEMDEKGLIILKVKLKAPGQVLATVNQVNGKADSSPESVIHGHADGLIYLDTAGFIDVPDATVEVSYNTAVQVLGTNNIKVNFVVQDSNGANTSKATTVILFQSADVAKVDYRAPALVGAFINEAKNRITLYFDETLDTTSIPSVDAFKISQGGKTAKVELKNQSKILAMQGKVTLTVSGITDISNLKISYQVPAVPLRDNAVARNKVESWIDTPVLAGTLSMDKIIVSGDGANIMVHINRGMYPDLATGKTNSKVLLKYGITPESAKPLHYEINGTGDYSFQSAYLYGDHHRLTYNIKVKKAPKMVENGKYYITMDATGLKDYAGDTITKVISGIGVPSAAETGIQPTEIYYSTLNRRLTIAFPEGHGLSHSVRGCFVSIQSNGKTHLLRADGRFLGRAVGEVPNTMEFDYYAFPFDPETFDWDNATVSCSSRMHSADELKMTQYPMFPSGKLYEGFEHVGVKVVP